MNKSKILLLSVLFINMKTIEERAANLAKEFATGKRNRETAVYRSCIQMATEQKQIDIEKAELNFCIFCSCYDNCDARYSCETFEKFCKAMEE